MGLDFSSCSCLLIWTDQTKPTAINVYWFQDFLGYHQFKSKTHQDEFCPEGLCKAAMFALFVKEELESWPEMDTRKRTWLTVPEAVDRCRHAWMRDALETGFSNWYADRMMTAGEDISGAR